VERAFAKLATLQLSVDLGEIVNWRQGRVTRLHLRPGHKGHRRVKARWPVTGTGQRASDA
jgi:hypothetical protein